MEGIIDNDPETSRQKIPKPKQENNSPIAGSTVASALLHQHTRSGLDEASLHQSSKEQQQRRRWFWIGIVRDAKQVQASTWDILAQVACQRGIHIHITVGQHVTLAVQQLQRQRIDGQQKQQTIPCAAVHIETEHDLGVSVESLPSNRVERIAMIRNAQRERVRQLWLQDRLASPSTLTQADVVIMADLDLFRLPTVSRVLEQAESIATTPDLDVICAAGVTMASQEELWYYDTYATVLLPDTYVHPLKRRLIKEYFAGENHSLVRSDNQHGSFTQGDLMRYLQQQAADTGTVRVRSCFGGLSIYRATTFFEPKCSYTRRDDQPDLDRYASENDGSPCEHVVFQTCLQDTPGLLSTAKIAIDPSLLLLWRKN